MAKQKRKSQGLNVAQLVHRTTSGADDQSVLASRINYCRVRPKISLHILKLRPIFCHHRPVLLPLHPLLLELSIRIVHLGR